MVDLSVIACPSCKRKVFTRNDMLYAALDGTSPCRACGRVARLDLVSRWMVSCLIALVLPVFLLYGDVFYSGHLFVFSMVVILAGWRMLSIVFFPLLSLEAAPGDFALNRRQSMLVFVVMLFVAIGIDALMASRFEPSTAVDADRPPASTRNF